jgi:hypothetical protein
VAVETVGGSLGVVTEVAVMVAVAMVVAVVVVMVVETVVEVTVAEGMAAVMTEAREVLVVPGALVAVGCKWQSLLRTTGYARTAC